MRFKIQPIFLSKYAEEFTEETAPDWLTSKNTVKGSTMDDSWFWNRHVLTLNVGESVKTDFQTITRIE